MGEEVDSYIARHSSTQCDQTIPNDTIWPFLKLEASLFKELRVTANFQDESTDIRYLDYSLDNGQNWQSLEPQSHKIADNDYYFTIDSNTLSQIDSVVWVRAADNCKNEVAQKIRISDTPVSIITPKSQLVSQAFIEGEHAMIFDALGQFYGVATWRGRGRGDSESGQWELPLGLPEHFWMRRSSGEVVQISLGSP